MLSPEQKLVRRRGVGGSDMTALCGLSKRWRPIDVYLSKVDVLPPLDEDEANVDCNRGRFLEPSVRAWYAHDNSCLVEEVGTLIHPEHRLVLATPDGIAKFADGRADRPIEVKCPRFNKMRDWSSGQFPHDLKVPDYYLCQTQWEMAVTGAKHCDVTVLLGDQIYTLTVDFDPELYASLRSLAEAFWDNCVVPQKAPDPDESESYLTYLGRMHPQATRRELLPASQDMMHWAKRFKDASDAISDLDKDRRLARSHLEQYIADAAGIDFGSGAKVTWTNNSERRSIDLDALKARCGISPADLEACTITKPGSRVFRSHLDKLGAQ
ncbi:MAG: hypothetical protein EOP64_00040 [Sphingomonas sp.]|nr:MAG: hypothetical protein EOP64_00040 [Sphingomonas sp.]